MGTEWYELDLGWHLITLLRWLGVVWDVQVAGPATQKPQAHARAYRWRWPWQE